MAAGQSKLEEQLAQRLTDARVMLYQGQLAEAEKQLRDLIPLHQRLLGPEHEDTLGSQASWALSLAKLGRCTEAEAILREVLQVKQQSFSFSMEHESTLRTVNMVGRCLLAQHRGKNAEPMLRSVHALDKRVLGPRHDLTLEIQMTLGSCLCADNQFEEAERLLRDGLEGWKARKDDPSSAPPYKVSMIGAGMRDLAGCLSKAGKLHEAESLLREAVIHHRHHMGEQHVLTIDCMRSRAMLLRALGNPAAAEVMYGVAVQASRVAYGWEKVETMDMTRGWVDCLLTQQKYKPAEALVRDTLSHVQQALGEDHDAVLQWMMNLACVLKKQSQASKHTEAEALLRRARELLRNKQA